MQKKKKGPAKSTQKRKKVPAVLAQKKKKTKGTATAFNFFFAAIKKYVEKKASYSKNDQ